MLLFVNKSQAGTFRRIGSRLDRAGLGLRKYSHNFCHLVNSGELQYWYFYCDSVGIISCYLFYVYAYNSLKGLSFYTTISYTSLTPVFTWKSPNSHNVIHIVIAFNSHISHTSHYSLNLLFFILIFCTSVMSSLLSIIVLIFPLLIRTYTLC